MKNRLSIAVLILGLTFSNVSIGQWIKVHQSDISIYVDREIVTSDDGIKIAAVLGTSDKIKIDKIKAIVRIIRVDCKRYSYRIYKNLFFDVSMPSTDSLSIGVYEYKDIIVGNFDKNSKLREIICAVPI